MSREGLSYCVCCCVVYSRLAGQSPVSASHLAIDVAGITDGCPRAQLSVGPSHHSQVTGFVQLAPLPVVNLSALNFLLSKEAFLQDVCGTGLPTPPFSTVVSRVGHTDILLFFLGHSFSMLPHRPWSPKCQDYRYAPPYPAVACKNTTLKCAITVLFWHRMLCYAFDHGLQSVLPQESLALWLCFQVSVILSLAAPLSSFHRYCFFCL